MPDPRSYTSAAREVTLLSRLGPRTSAQMLHEQLVHLLLRHVDEVGRLAALQDLDGPARLELAEVAAQAGLGQGARGAVAGGRDADGAGRRAQELGPLALAGGGLTRAHQGRRFQY